MSSKSNNSNDHPGTRTSTLSRGYDINDDDDQPTFNPRADALREAPSPKQQRMVLWTKPNSTRPVYINTAQTVRELQHQMKTLMDIPRQVAILNARSVQQEETIVYQRSEIEELQARVANLGSKKKRHRYHLRSK